MCWTCAPGCMSWTEIYTSYADREALLHHRLDPSLFTEMPFNVAPPLACDKRMGDNVWRRKFDAHGHLTHDDAMGSRREWTWDAQGHLLTAKDTSHLRQWTHDAEGRLSSHTTTKLELVPNSYPAQYTPGAVISISRWDRDPGGRVVYHAAEYTPNKPPTREERNEYDECGNLISQTRQGWYGMPTYTRTFRYDARGRLVEVTRDGRVSIHITYDGERTRIEDDNQTLLLVGGRIRSRQYMGASVVRNILTVDEQGRTVAERLQIEGKPSQEQTWSWDWGPFGITREVRSTGQRQEVSRWKYDPAGALLERDDDVFNDQFTYDAAGRMTRQIRTSRDPNRRATETDVTYTWSANGHFLGASGDMRRQEKWTWRDGRLVTRSTTDWRGTTIDHDYACLDAVMRAMPRRKFREKPAPDAEFYEIATQNRRESFRSRQERNRIDPGLWGLP
jgi:YD repeat-containing protein